MSEQTTTPTPANESPLSTEASILSDLTSFEFVEREVIDWNPVLSLPLVYELQFRAKITFKLCRLYELTESLRHDDHNEKQNYTFTSADAIFDEARKALSKVNLAIFPVMGNFEEVPIMQDRNPDERRGTYLSQDFRFALTDAETGYSIVLPWRGEVIEYGDKAVNKASTQATKYFLRTLLLLPLNDDEPDRSSPDSRETAKSKQAEERARRAAEERVKNPVDKEWTDFVAKVWPNAKNQNHKDREDYEDMKLEAKSSGIEKLSLFVKGRDWGTTKEEIRENLRKSLIAARIPGEKVAQKAEEAAPAQEATEETTEPPKEAQSAKRNERRGNAQADPWLSFGLLPAKALRAKTLFAELKKANTLEAYTETAKEKGFDSIESAIAKFAIGTKDSDSVNLAGFGEFLDEAKPKKARP